ncbi:uncharacterized protein [Amphiura filiformis]|uniref:uncharacterized protein n=1 Tax=Amphiura filiformis TaxID=82378 RepID=UPI003B225E60
MASIYRRHISAGSINTAVTEAVADFSSYSPATVLMFALSSFGGALALVPILLPDSMWLESTEIYAVLRMVLSIVVSLICLSLVYFKRKAIKLGHWPGCATVENEDPGTDIQSWIPTPFLNKTVDKQAKYMLATIIIFGSCSIVSSVLQTVTEPTSTVPDMIHCVLDVLSLCLQMVFFYYYIHGRLPNIRGLHYTIALLIGIKVCTWIAVSLEPLWFTNDNGLNDTIIINGSFSTMFTVYGITSTNTTVGPLLEFFDEFFETFYTEFHTVAVGVLFYIWHSMETFNRPTSLTRVISTQNETAPILGEYQPDLDFGQSLEIRGRKRNKVIIIIVSTISSIAYSTICILTMWELFKPLGNIYIYRLITLFYYTAFNVIAIIELYSLRSKPDTNTSPMLNSSEYIILFTACSESVYYFLRGVASIGSLASPGNVEPNQFEPSPLHHEDVPEITDLMAGVFLSYSFIAIFNCWIQTMMLLVVRRKQVPEHLKNVLILFAGVNFAEWLQNAILLGLARKDSVLKFDPVMNNFYGTEKVRILGLILLPTMILFRFHLAIVSVELAHET